MQKQAKNKAKLSKTRQGNPSSKDPGEPEIHRTGRGTRDPGDFRWHLTNSFAQMSKNP